MVTNVFKNYADLLLLFSRLKLLDVRCSATGKSEGIVQYLKICQLEHGFRGDEIEFLDLSYIITPHL